MRLKQLRISGFKSFADTTVIEFPGAVAGIVGPNGCGKSNVIDAIRWVLGEARVSELRGSTSMSELIFSGSVNRPASSRASVELVLDNSDGTVKGAWGRYTELSVKRVVTRDGSNAYLINNQQVRRRDVQDIFMGTGLGPRSYAIISQGMISNFIKAKPEELRVYLEEAAGVSKYKERRRETETALNSTRSNLEKVSYLQETKRAEIERLTAEAEVAARWQDLSKQKDQAELLWFFLQERDAAAAVNKVDAQIAAREADLLQGRGEQQRLAVQIEELKGAARSRREVADKAREEAWQTNSRVSEIQGAIERIVAQKDSLAREIASAAESIARRRSERDAAAGRIAEIEDKTREMTEMSAALQEEAAAAEESLAAAQEDCEQKKSAYESARSAASGAQSRIQVLTVQIQSLGREMNDVEARLQDLENEERMTQAPDEARCAELSEQIAEEEGRFEELNAQTQELKDELTQRRSAWEQNRSEKEKKAAEHARTAARLQALEALQQKSQSEGRLAAWLEKMGLKDAARLYEKLDVEPGWVMALEAVLSARSGALGMSMLERAAGFAYDPPPARLVFFAPGAAKHRSENPSLTPIASKVRVTDPTAAGAVAAWLDGIYAAQTLDEAVSQRGELGAGERFVTPAGHVVDAVSVSFWAEEGEASGAMSRAAEIRELAAKSALERDELDRLDEELTAAAGGCRMLEARSAQAASQVDDCRSRLHELQLEHSSLSAALAAWKEKSRRSAEQREELQARREEFAAQLQQVEDDFEAADAALAEVEQRSLEAKVALEEAEQTAANLQENTRNLQNKVQMLRLQAQTNSERIRDARERQSAAAAEIEELSAQMEELASRREGLDETAEREGLTRVLEELNAKNEAHKAAEEASRAAEEALEQARVRSTDLAAAQTPLLQEISELKVRRESWVTQSAVFTEHIDNAAADRKALALKVEEEGLRASQLKSRVARINESIAALGPVNHAALENLQESQRAMQETERQVADLEEAIANLEATIRKIDAETRELLKNTFEEVNRNFGEMFTGLFGGGSAELRMSGDEILEAGVEVTARPPGKKNASVKLLSGGEQAMTATALVFAIFKLNPAPFCLLDEVDAPLDEANQDRLARRILQMSAHTQFMMITHHRVTMEHLKTLIGVTMKEPGGSRVVSVDVEQATEMAG